MTNGVVKGVAELLGRALALRSPEELYVGPSLRETGNLAFAVGGADAGKGSGATRLPDRQRQRAVPPICINLEKSKREGLDEYDVEWIVAVSGQIAREIRGMEIDVNLAGLERIVGDQRALCGKGVVLGGGDGTYLLNEKLNPYKKNPGESGAHDRRLLVVGCFPDQIIHYVHDYNPALFSAADRIEEICKKVAKANVQRKLARFAPVNRRYCV